VPDIARAFCCCTRCAGGGCRDIDSREVFENDMSDDGVVLPRSSDSLLLRRKIDGKKPKRLVGSEPRLSAGGEDGDGIEADRSAGFSCISDANSGTLDTLEGPRACWAGDVGGNMACE